MSTQRSIYVDLEGREWNLAKLPISERRLIAEIQKIAKTCERSAVDPAQRWCDFDNYWWPAVLTHGESLGLSRKRILKLPVYQIAQDLSGRMAISLGLAREADYRDELLEIIQTKFKSQRAFCQAAGLSEDMVSHVLAGRKHLALDTLVDAMKRIGYTLKLVPVGQQTKKVPREVA